MVLINMPMNILLGYRIRPFFIVTNFREKFDIIIFMIK
jgi:hypothetical protein